MNLPVECQGLSGGVLPKVEGCPWSESFDESSQSARGEGQVFNSEIQDSVVNVRQPAHPSIHFPGDPALKFSEFGPVDAKVADSPVHIRFIQVEADIHPSERRSEIGESLEVDNALADVSGEPYFIDEIVERFNAVVGHLELIHLHLRPVILEAQVLDHCFPSSHCGLPGK